MICKTCNKEQGIDNFYISNKVTCKLCLSTKANKNYVKGKEDLPKELKRCKCCNEIKSRTNDFYNTFKKDGTYYAISYCKSCMRDKMIFRTYKLTREDVNNILVSQNNKCTICLDIINDKKFCIDHSHKTGKVRSILCDHCNTGIGKFKENTEILESAIKYLLKFNVENKSEILLP